MEKKIKKIVILLLIVLVLLILAIIFINITNRKTIKSEKKLTYINNNNWNEEVYPDGMPKLVRTYKGNLTAQNMGKSIYYYTTQIIPKYYADLKNASEDEINSYFDENSKVILLDIGIEKKEDFVKLIKSIQSLSSENLILSSFRIDKDNIKARSQYTETTLLITYEGNEEIAFTVKIYNKMKEDSSSLVYTASSQTQKSTKVENKTE